MNENFKYRLLVVAPSSIHLRNFLKRIEGETSAIHVITSSENSRSYPETVVDFSFKKIQNYYLNSKKIRKVFRTFKPDLVHIHQLNSVTFFTLLGLKNEGVPLVATAWGSDVLLANTRGGFLRWVLKYNLRHIDALTSDSREVEDKMKEIAQKPLDATICNYGADTPSITRPKENIIYSNRLHEGLYRVDKILEHFAAFSATPQGKNWRLIVAGSGSQSDKLKELTENLNIGDKVEFQGWVEKEQNEANYARAKIWVSIPESDATPISMLEAMYHGCYPVVSDLQSLREWIDDGKNGRLVSDAESNFFKDLNYESLHAAAEQNRKLVQERGSASAATKCFSSIHRRLIQGK